MSESEIRTTGNLRSTEIILATQSGPNAEIYKLINYWLNYDNSLLKIITRLTEVRYDDKGERFLGIVPTSRASKIGHDFFR